MLYLLGSSLVGRRAGDLVALGRSLQARYGQKPQLVGFGRIAVAAAHAHAAAPGLFAACELHAAPPSWSDAVRSRQRIDYASAVHGALLKYDWTDLVPSIKCAEAVPASQLVNAGFENEVAGEFGGWKIPSTGVWKVVDGAGRNGTRALVYETEDPNAKYAWVTQRVAVEGGRTYAYETWILGKDIRCDMQGAWPDRRDVQGDAQVWR